MPARSIGDAIRRAREYLTRRPDEARYTGTAAVARIVDGLHCLVEGPEGTTIETDMSTGVGGGASAPSPVWLMRASHAACDATLITMRAVEEGVELSRLEVAVDSESDDRGMLGDAAVPAGPIRIRVRVRVAAPGVPEQRIREIVEWAREHSPVDDALDRRVPIDVDLTVEPA